MKRYVWIGITALCIASFAVTQFLALGAICGYVLTGAIAFSAFKALSSNIIYVEEQKALKEAEERALLEPGKKDTYTKCMDELSEIEKNRYLSKYVKAIKKQFSDFDNKEKALKKIIALNDGNSEKFITQKSDAVRELLIKNLKRFVKRCLAISATNDFLSNEDYSLRYNRAVATGEISSFLESEKRFEKFDELTEVVSAGDELISWYDKLIAEVARMGDNFDEKDAGLQSLIENLQEMRLSKENDDDDDEIHLEF